MKITIVKPGFEILTPIDEIKTFQARIERAGRTCYKSEDRITADSAGRFVRMVIARGHESVLEHCSISVLIVCSRAASHQLVRHRIAAYSQESQRYCNYGEKGFAVICPPAVCRNISGTFEHIPLSSDCEICTDKDCGHYNLIHWLNVRALEFSEYLRETENGIPGEDARYNLPNAMKTEIVATYNLREWRHIFKLRALDDAAQWEIRGIMQGILQEFRVLMPDAFALEND